MTSHLLTPDAILALAPDPGSAASGRTLASPHHWPSLNAVTLEGGPLVWGECQGSGRTPYLVGIDLLDPARPATKCSCPSRKFPCKHALALLLLHTLHPDAFEQASAPESLHTWVQGRRHRAEQQGAEQHRTEQHGAEPPDPARRVPDPAAQARRRAAREHKVTGGLGALHTFLKDLVRDGLAQAAARPYSDWDTQAARLVDAQAPGVARHVGRIPELLGNPAGLLSHLGWLALLCEAWVNRDTLTPAELADLRAAIGFPLDQAALLTESGVSAAWTVMGVSTSQEDVLTTRRTWLQHGGGGRSALLLDFAAGGRPLPPGLIVGQSVQAELVYAPSATPQRAVLKGVPGDTLPPHDPPPALDANALLDAHADLLGHNPWLDRAAYALGPVRLLPGDPWQAVDAGGHALPLSGPERTLFILLAVSGGQPLTLFGEWDTRAFTPLSHLHEAAVIPTRPEDRP